MSTYMYLELSWNILGAFEAQKSLLASPLNNTGHDMMHGIAKATVFYYKCVVQAIESDEN